MQVSKSRWARQGILLGVLSIGLLSRAGADGEPGSRKRIGNAGAWKNTVTGAVLKNLLYSVTSNGGLYVTGLAHGNVRRVSGGFGKTKYLLPGDSYLCAIDSDGSLYRVKPSTGARTRLGKAGDWKNTISATAANGKLYTVEAGGALYRTNPVDATWIKLGGNDFGDTKMMVGHDKAQYSPTGIFTVEGDGTLYKVNPVDGTWKKLGAGGEWKGAKAGAIISETDDLYGVNAGGVLQYYMLSSTPDIKPSTMGKPIYKNTKMLFIGHDGPMPAIYALDSDGSLYAVEMAPMAG